MKLPIFGKFSRLNREFHPKNFPYFWNSRIQEYFRTAGVLEREFQTSPSNCLYSRSWVTFKESYSLKDSRGYFIPKIWTIFKQGVSLLSKNTPNFPIPKFGTILKPREFQVEGVSFLSLKNVCIPGAEPISWRVTVWKIPAVIKIPKFWTILKSREF